MKEFGRCKWGIELDLCDEKSREETLQVQSWKEKRAEGGNQEKGTWPEEPCVPVGALLLRRG